MRNFFLVLIALIIIITAVYWQVGAHDFLNIDDDFLITDNIHVTTGLTKENIVWALSPVRGIGWHPVTWLTHMVDVELYGLNARGHHMTNVLFHIASALCLFLFIYRLSNSLWKSAFISSLFALHPMHIESVAWVAERRDVLSAFFGFMTLWLYVEYVLSRKQKFYLLSLFAFVLGLMSKPIIVTFPIIMIMLDYWPLSRFGGEVSGFIENRHEQLKSKKLSVFTEKIPFLILSLISSVITLNIPPYSEGEIIPLLLRVENAITSYVVYLHKMVAPINMSVFYPFNYSLELWRVIFSLLILICVTVTAIILRKKFPYILVGWFWFVITLAPVIGIIQISYYSCADRYTYISYVGPFIVITFYAEYITNKFRNKIKILSFLGISIVCILTFMTYNHIKVWKNSVTLFSHALDVTSKNNFAHHNLGLAYMKLNKLDEAIIQLRAANLINPNSNNQHYNYALALQKKGLLDDAIIEYKKTVYLNPKEVDAYNNLGMIYMSKGMYRESLHEFDKAIAIDNNYDAAKVNRNLVYRYMDMKNNNR